MRLENLLVQRGLVTAKQIEEVRSNLTPGKRLDQAMLELGYLAESELLSVLGDALGLDVISLTEKTIDPEALRSVSSKLIFRNQVLPFERHNGSLVVATSNPFDLATLDEIHQSTGLHIEPVLAPTQEIIAAIKVHFGVGGETVGALVGDAEPIQLVEGGTGADDADELAQEASVIKLVNEILIEAIEQRTSDIHIEPTESSLRIRYRIDGVLQVQALPPEIKRFAPAIVSRLKIMAKLNIAEKRLPQDGRIQLRLKGREVDIRLSIIPMTFGEGVVLRILDKSRMKFSLEGVGMMPDHLSLWEKLIELPHGILLVTGPTGSGKTTTLYSALQEIARDTIKIITVEDPVEYQFDRIQQIQVQTKIGLTFGSSLRAILRHDPDVVLIGEIRDLETAEIAIQASLTGHLVFSTLHTNDAPSAFTRLTDMGVEPFLVASTVEAVLAQRLVRMICAECKEIYEPDPNDIPPDLLEYKKIRPMSHYHGKGCRSCRQSGYRGRQGLFELLAISDPIRELVVDRSSASRIKAQALKEGMVTLRKDSFRKLASGLTTIEEMLRVTKADEGIRQPIPAPTVSNPVPLETLPVIQP